MTMYRDGFGNIYTEEEAIETIQEDMTWEDYEDYIRSAISFHDFFDRVRTLPRFLDEFYNEFYEAEVEKFNREFESFEEED